MKFREREKLRNVSFWLTDAEYAALVKLAADEEKRIPEIVLSPSVYARILLLRALGIKKAVAFGNDFRRAAKRTPPPRNGKARRLNRR